MDNFIDIHTSQLNKFGEELCGDQVRVERGTETTRIVLSDGLGSGVKANILATLSSEIVITMLREGAAIQDIIETVLGTLPICQERNIAYATLTVIVIDHQSMDFRILNYENPPPILIQNGEIIPLEASSATYLEREFSIYEGHLNRDDFLAIFSDGVWYAGMGVSYNFGWGWDNIAGFIASKLNGSINHAETIVESVMYQTRQLYAEQPGDDASVVGILNRKRRKAMVFTGPPEDKANDTLCSQRLLNFNGRRIICGGTTSNIVARELDENVYTRMDTLREDVPPIGSLPGVDLVAEGILTLHKTIEIIQEVDGDYSMLPNDRNGAMLLSLELLVADDITFMVGQAINSYYQNPLLPTSVSIRTTLIEQLVAILRSYGKEVTVNYY